MSKKFSFGQLVIITGKYTRRTGTGSSAGWGYNIKREYVAESLKTPVSVIFLGWRTISDGETHCDDDGCIWRPKVYKRAALVAYSARRNPIYVPEDMIEGS